MTQILRDAGMTVEPHDTHFPNRSRVDDPEWLELIAERRWIGLTTDEGIVKLNQVEIEALMRFEAKAFVCIARNRPFPRVAQNIVNSRHKLNQFVHKHRREPAFVAKLYMASGQRFERGYTGKVEMFLTHTEWKASQSGN